MRFVIVGPGALGAIFGARLSQAGHDVTFLGRTSPRLAAICRHGLRLESLNGTVETLPIPVSADPSVVKEADVLLVLVKTYDTVTAMSAVRRFLASETIVVTLQNGLGNAETIRDSLGKERTILAGVTSQAATRVDPDLVVHTGSGPSLIGYESAHERRIAEKITGHFAAAGLPAAAVGDIDRWIWNKVAINAAINGLTALGGFENGAIADRPDLLDAAENVADEAASVARALGIELGAMRPMLLETARMTASNRSSMLQDIEAGRPTEVESIHGAIGKAAVRVGIATPATDLLAALIRARSERLATKEMVGVSTE